MDKDNDIKVWLYDISVAISNIENFLPEQRIFAEFCKDLKTKHAVERNIEIIGEAMNRILKVNPEISISSSRKIVDTRNVVIHNYEKITNETIWAIVINYLPKLKQEVDNLLK